MLDPLLERGQGRRQWRFLRDSLAPAVGWRGVATRGGQVGIQVPGVVIRAAMVGQAFDTHDYNLVTAWKTQHRSGTNQRRGTIDHPSINPQSSAFT
jgi:hypothetical protein